MDILEPISDEAVTNTMTINPLKSTIFFCCPNPPDMSVGTM